MPLITAFITAVRVLSVACGIVAALALGAAVLVVCQLVTMRYILGAPTIWQTEFVTYAIVASTFIGSPYVLLEKAHVNVDLLPHYLGHRARLGLALLVSAAALLFCVVLAWTGWEYFWEAYSRGWRTETVWGIPLWIPALPMPVGISMLALQYVADILCLLTGRDAPFGLKPEYRP